VTRCLQHARLLAGALALVLGSTLVAPPAFAAGSPNAVSPHPIATAANARVAAMTAEALAQTAQAPPAGKNAPAAAPVGAGKKPFFKTTTGAIALALLAGGIGYTIYSAVDSRKAVKSPVR